jgi:hypothetical protein
MEYVEALEDARVQYAIISGRIDEQCEQEVLLFMQNILKESQAPQYGYIVVRNMYAHFARRIDNYVESTTETNLEYVINLIDDGEMVRVGIDTKRSAEYWSPGRARLSEMKLLLSRTKRELGLAEKFLRQEKPGMRRVEYAADAQALRRRVKRQQATLNYRES